MKHTKYYILAIAAAILGLGVSSCHDSNDHSTKAERKLIKEGNELYADTLYPKAYEKYNDALLESPASEVARFNSTAALYHIGRGSQNDSLASKAMSQYVEIGKSASDSTIRQKAYYNLGNIEFNDSNYKQSVEYYKEALRIDPSNSRTRQNLLVALLKMPPEDQNQDQQQQQQQQEQQQQEQQQQQQEQQQPEMSQNAEQLLQTMQNRENETRQKVKQQSARPSSLDKPW